MDRAMPKSFPRFGRRTIKRINCSALLTHQRSDFDYRRAGNKHLKRYLPKRNTLLSLSPVTSPSWTKLQQQWKGRPEIVYAVTILRQFLLSRSVTIKTDHKLSEFNINLNNETPNVASARLTWWAITLMAFDFAIKQTPGRDIGQNDAMSWLTFKNNEREVLVAQIPQVTFEKPFVDRSHLRKELQSYNVSSRIIRQIKSGSWIQCFKIEKSFANISIALTT